jgi:hypothetical protein
MVTTTVADGETCGQIETEPELVQANCDSGADCVFFDDSYSDGGGGLALGICTQAFDSCPAEGGCAPGYDCVQGVVSRNLCLKKCVTAADCPAPFQMCPFGHCQIEACLQDSDCTDVSAHCSDRLCVRGDASTF